jgi:capsular polysaccharide transport system permease protein
VTYEAQKLQSSFENGLVNTLRTWSAVLHLEVEDKFQPYGLGLLERVMEPIFHIAIMVFWHWLIRAQAIYGPSKILYVSTGIFPAFVFVHLSSQFKNVVGLKRYFPGILPIDVISVRAVVILFAYLLVGLVLFSYISVFQCPLGTPSRVWPVVLALVSLSIMGYGASLINAVLDEFLPFWGIVWAALSRGSIIFAGPLYVPDFLPIYIRNYICMNPVLQAVELFRQGFYPTFPTLIFNPGLLFWSTLGILAFGLSLERFARPHVGRVKLFSLR